MHWELCHCNRDFSHRLLCLSLYIVGPSLEFFFFFFADIAQIFRDLGSTVICKFPIKPGKALFFWQIHACGFPERESERSFS